MKNLFKQLGYFVIDFLETIVLSFAIFVVIYVFVTQPHKVKGDSMLDGFHSNEYLLTDKVTYRFKKPARGDVVVFRYPLAPQYDYIKRIIGLPQEEIEINNGRVTIFNKENPAGMVLAEKYLKPGTKTVGRAAIPEGTKVAIGENQYVVLGDNRSQSSDSREWGPIPFESLIGRVWLRYWPPQALAFFGEPPSH